MTPASPASNATFLVHRVLRNAVVVVAVTAIFGFKAMGHSALTAAAPPDAFVEIASR